MPQQTTAHVTIVRRGIVRVGGIPAPQGYKRRSFGGNRACFTIISMYNGKKSWKLLGKIGDELVVVLLDCGASHNFISNDLIGRCGLQTLETPTYVVEVEDGRRVHCHGKCDDFILEIQGLKIQQEFFIFEIGGVYIMLGVEWIASLRG